MTPTPEMPVPASPSPAQDQGKKVVISGMSGLYPRSRYVKDLEHILYNKINPITTEDVRWNYNHPEVAQHAGSVPDLELFDAQFFKVHYRLGSCMDSMARKILENAYEAIYDAGVNPDQLSGKKIGVYIGTCFSETEKACFYMASSRTGFGIAGCSKTMFANRISYWLNAKGPSLSIDDACCSSTAALEQAYLAISRGECEAAIVGGGNLCLHPQSSVHYGRIMTLSKDGTTKSFDQNADGCAKSEAINVLFLQKSSDALRVYADLVHVKTEYVKILDGVTGPRYGFYRDPLDSIKFLYSFYKEAGIPPSVVEYVEAFGSAVPEVDKSELETLDKVFCNGRKGPLLVGSVMSNIGYGEAASGISAVTKVLLGYNRGELAGNLHFDTPRTDVEALREGRIQILQDNTSFGKTYTAVNSMSVTGVNAHVLLHGRYKPKDPNRYKSSIPQLVTLSGRQESSVTRVIEHLKSNPIDYEELGLLRNIHKNRISGHLGRGYIILDTNDQQKTVSLSEKSDYFDDAKRPLWFVYSGMGSQWPEMGTQLMRIPIFAKAIERCRLALEPKGIDIVNIITSTEKDIFDNILHSFVGIAAVQIGLTDVLRELGIVPDNIIGHSVGELGCAYADGCLTAEEMILSAYSRGLVSLETEFIRGSMAAVGVGYQQISKMCPPEIEVACHNGPESSTISGPADVMKQFVAELTDKGIFAKEVPCSNIAYHSRYIAKAGPGLLKYLKEVIPAPKARTERWVSTSVPQNNWSDPAAKYSSAEYHTNNLLSPVLFEETIKLIPSNAVLIEIAPHGLLQAILKRSLPESCINIPLTRRGHPDNARMILDAVGKLYMEGFNPDVQALYPKIEFPVSSGTPMLSHLVDWAHGEKWALPLYVSARRTVAASSKYTISLHDEEYSFLRGHVIRGKTVVPFSFALVAVWDTLAMTMKVPKKELNVQFSNVTFFAEPVLYEQRQIRLSVALHRGQGKFEVMHDNYKIVTGIITSLEDKKNKEEEDSPDQSEDTDDCLITSQEVYQLLCERDYRYRDEFCVIRGINETMTEADLLWNENWVTFIDGLIQFHTLRSQNSTVSRLNFIRNMTIDVSEHNNNIREAENNIKLIKAKAFDVYDRISCGGIIIEHMDVKNVLPLVKNQVDLKTLSFVPRFQSNCDISTSLQVFLQILAENVNKDKIKVVGLMAGTEESSAFVNMRNIAKNNNVAGVNVEYQSIPKFGLQQLHADIIKDADLVLIQNLSNDDSMCQILHKILNSNSFVLNEENVLDNVARTRPSALYSVVAVNNNKNLNIRLELAKWRPTSSSAIASSAFTIRSESDLPLLVNARKTLLPQNGLIILSSYPPVNGLVNLVKQWRAEKTRNAIYLIMVKQGSPKIKGLDELPNMDLAFNVLENGVWGGEYYLPIKETATQAGDVMLVSEQIGNLDSLKWVQVHKQTKPGVPVTVHYAAINMSDVKRATGVTELGSDTSGYGMDFSGTTERGERVMGLVQSGSARSHVIAHPELLWPVPKHWSLEEAATIPLAYTYAYYLLLKVVKFNKDYVSKSILVHGGAGALGQAMINVALANRYKVFATVSNMQKKKFLMRLFPDLKEEYIGCSRDETFADMVLQHTDGIGAGLVVCCVRGDLKNSSFKSCSMFGSIFDMMQIKQDDNFVFGMYHLARARNYMSLDISSIFSNPCIMQQIQLLVAQGIASGFIRPLTRTVYSAQDPQRAFRLLASSSHRGRVLLKFDQSQPQLVNRLACSPDHNHLIVSDGQPLALQFVDTLISRGAKKIHLNLTSQSPPITCKVRSWKNQGVKVTVDTLDLSDESTVCNLLKHITKSTGFLAGVFIIQSTVTNAMVKIFDTATRKCCPYMKYFLVVSDVASQENFLNRFSDGVPATCLDISQLEEMQYRGFNRYPQAVDVIERSLCTSYPILKALKKSIPSTSLIQQIANVTNVTLPEETPEIATLESIGIDPVKSHIVTKFLNDVHNIYIDHDEIPSLTLERVKEIEESLKEIDLKESEGLSTFYSCVDPDELLATTESVMLPTLTNSSTMRDDEFNVNDTHMCIVPGLDGLYARFHTICERLKLPALVLQPGLDHLYEDADHLADRYSKVLLRRTGLNKNFILLGYEFGVIVALKLAAILEENGLSGTVFCIGDGPEETIKRIEAQLQSFKSESALQIAIIKHMCALIGKIDNDVLEKALIGCSTWDQQVKACVRVLLGQVPHSAQYARNLIEAAYVRIKMAREYKAMPKLLQSQIVLIRAGGNSTETSSLQKYSVKPVIIHDIQTPLNQMTNDLRCTAIINKYLPAEVLEAFNNRNLCDTYLLNADTFMTSATDD